MLEKTIEDWWDAARGNKLATIACLSRRAASTQCTHQGTRPYYVLIMRKWRSFVMSLCCDSHSYFSPKYIGVGWIRLISNYQRTSSFSHSRQLTFHITPHVGHSASAVDMAPPVNHPLYYRGGGTINYRNRWKNSVSLTLPGHIFSCMINVAYHIYCLPKWTHDLHRYALIHLLENS